MKEPSIKRKDWINYRPLKKDEVIEENDEVYDDEQKGE